MQGLYTFDFLKTISKQLQESLDSLEVSTLTPEAISNLIVFQTENHRKQGVYVLHLKGFPKYIGKATNVAARLKKHLRKLSGRQNLNLQDIGYKCLLLDESMSTAANEDLLIKEYKVIHTDLWNGEGLGPNDPGQRRDTTEPGKFDRIYPIRLDILINDIDDNETIQALCSKLKKSLPFVFRYNLEGQGGQSIDLAGIERSPRTLTQEIINNLGPKWRGAILSYGIVFYKSKKEYPFGETINSIVRHRP